METVAFNKRSRNEGLEFELHPNDLILKECNGFGSGKVTPYLVLEVRSTRTRPNSVATVVKVDSWTEDIVSYSTAAERRRTIRKSTGKHAVWLFKGDSARDRIYDIWLTDRPRSDAGYMK
jgi:hypothetical protein